MVVESTSIRKPQKQKKQAGLTESQEFTQALIRSAGIGIYIVREGKFVYVSPVFQELLGYTEEELIGTYSISYVHPEDRQAVRKEAIQRLKGQSLLPYEYRLIRKNGDVICVLERVTSIEYEGKRALVGNFMDVTERKQAEEALRQSEERYRTSLENIEDGYFEVDLAGNFTFFNDATCRALEYSRQELMGRSYRALTVEGDMGAVYQTFNQVYQTGEPIKEFSWKSVRRDGTERFAEASVSPLRNQKGEIIGFRCVSRDVTERKQMEEALRASEERYRTILEEMEDSYFEVDLSGHYTFFNDSLCRAFGCSREELLGASYQGTSYRAYMTEKDAKTVFKAFNQVYRTGKPNKGLTYELVRKDGSTGFDELSAFPLRNQEGKIIGFRGIGHDVTERKRMEEALRASEEKYRTILDNIEEGYFEVGLGGNFTFFNDSLCRSLGYTRDEMIGMNYRVFTPEEDVKTVFKTFNQVYRTGKPVEGFAWKTIRKNGTKGFAEASVSPLRNQAGEIIGFRGISRDVTERKRMEREREALLKDLKKVNRKLEQSNKELQDFVYVASHDLREPLRKITSFGTLLQDSLKGKLDEDQRENFEFMIDGATRMQMMIDDLLAYSRVTTKAKPSETVDLNEVIEDLKKLELAIRLDETKGIIRVPEPLLPVNGDPSQIHQLFQNLIGNGLKFHRDGVPPEVTIRTSQIDDDMVRVEVEDNGIGIDEEYCEQIFTMFKRLHSRTRYEGSGIGLAVCKKIVNRHGGDIGVKSNQGEGSTFWFTLPRGSYAGDN